MFFLYRSYSVTNNVCPYIRLSVFPFFILLIIQPSTPNSIINPNITRFCKACRPPTPPSQMFRYIKYFQIVFVRLQFWERRSSESLQNSALDKSINQSIKQTLSLIILARSTTMVLSVFFYFWFRKYFLFFTFLLGKH